MLVCWLLNVNLILTTSSLLPFVIFIVSFNVRSSDVRSSYCYLPFSSLLEAKDFWFCFTFVVVFVVDVGSYDVRSSLSSLDSLAFDHGLPLICFSSLSSWNWMSDRTTSGLLFLSSSSSWTSDRTTSGIITIPLTEGPMVVVQLLCF